MTAKSRRCAVGIGVALLIAWFALGLFSRVLAAFLVVDEPADNVPYIAIVDWHNGPDGDRCCDVAAKLYRETPSRHILLIESGRNRLVEIGVLPKFETLCRNELEKRGLPPQAITTIRSDGHDDYATARAIRAWLTDHPRASALLLCERFRSAYVRCVLDKALGPTLAARVRVRGLPDRRFDETNWWTSRSGFKAFGIAWCRRIHGWYASQDYRSPPRYSADDYERNVRQTLTGAAP